MKHARQGTFTALGLQERLSPAASIPKCPDKSRIRKSDMHRWHGAQHSLSDLPVMLRG